MSFSKLIFFYVQIILVGFSYVFYPSSPSPLCACENLLLYDVIPPCVYRKHFNATIYVQRLKTDFYLDDSYMFCDS